MKKLLVLFMILSVSTTLAAKDPIVDITVTLSPAGSFQITTSKVKGKLKKKGNVYKASKLSVKVKDLETGIELRDEHTRKRIMTKKHKKIIVTDIIAKDGKGKGKIEIKGIKKSFKFMYSISKKTMNAKFKLNLSHFKIKDLSYMGVGAKKIINLKIKMPIK
jgi:hypothetical protein